MSSPFVLKDCTLAVMSTGNAATSLIQMRDILIDIPVSSIYYHFWGGRLRSGFVHPEYPNDFAHWAKMFLHDDILSERLGVIDPTEYRDLEVLRKVLIETIEDRIDDIEFIIWSKKEGKFHFLQSIIIVFDSGITVNHPAELKEVLTRLPGSSFYYHFIDARSRTPEGSDDFTNWLSGFKDEFSELINKIQHVDPYFLTLTEIKEKLIEIFNQQFP